MKYRVESKYQPESNIGQSSVKCLACGAVSGKRHHDSRNSRLVKINRFNRCQECAAWEARLLAVETRHRRRDERRVPGLGVCLCVDCKIARNIRTVRAVVA